MKTLTSSLFTMVLTLFLVAGVMAQNSMIQYNRPAGFEGLNVFEAPKTTDVTFDGLKIFVGGDFAVQYQSLSQENDIVLGDANTANSLADLGNNFNLPTANLNINVQLEDGVRMYLRTYLSSRHHVEGWVKGGYLQIDNLDFIQEGFLSGLMENFRIKAGMDDINYGDAMFRRSDNATSIYNPFVGNYLMDSFTTEPFLEFTYLNDGIIGVLGFTNGRLNQSPLPGDDGFVTYAKAGYDTQVNDDLRFRITGSIYNSTDKSTRDYLYGGDRAGSRYYGVMNTELQMRDRNTRTSDFAGRFDPGFATQRSIMINPFVKFQGLEFFGLIELISDNSDGEGAYTHIGAEVLYRLGEKENFYLGGRFNSVTGEATSGADTQDLSRINIGGGWFMTNNILTKIEYMSQTYGSDGWGALETNASFDGLVIEAVIGF